MKKIIIITLFITYTLVNLCAENETSIAGLWISETSKIGGGFEVGLTLLNKDGWLIRNNISLKVCGSTPIIKDTFGEFSVEDKILIGGNIKQDNILIKPYGYLSTALGNINLVSWVLDFGIGGGFELGFTKESSFFIEYGGVFYVPLSNNIPTIYGGSAMTIGYRYYI